jgi:hypothetical protein
VLCFFPGISVRSVRDFFLIFYELKAMSYLGRFAPVLGSGFKGSGLLVLICYGLSGALG